MLSESWVPRVQGTKWVFDLNASRRETHELPGCCAEEWMKQWIRGFSSSMQFECSTCGRRWARV